MKANRPKLVKIFQGSDAQVLEQEINRWIERNPVPEIISITQSESLDPAKPGRNITITVLFVPVD